MARFFIDRPVFAWVLAIITMLLGGLSLTQMPVAQYPSIAPPSISVTTTYPGASAETVQNTVIQPIEQQLSGLDGLMYFSSEATKDGSVTITLYFEQGTDPDTAQVQVQNKVSAAESRLPTQVRNQGVRVAKAAKNFLMVLAFYSEDGSMSSQAIADFVASNIQDELSRTNGVGDYQLLGSQYAMRIWLDPNRLNQYSLMPGDVTAAISSQNVQIAAGEIGALPARPGQELNATIIGPSYLTTAEAFGQILVKTQTDGSRVLLRDVATVELGGESYSTSARYNGRPAAGIGLKLASGANALNAAESVQNTIESLRASFPAGLQVAYPYDTTPFVRLSIEDVVKTLLEAILLVFLVMLLFLQNLRATLIPTIAVPVVLLGTFAVLHLFGYSINTLTMFGMVLAIGLLVDDAIVVVENVERVMAEEKLSPREATRRSMDQITGALIGVAMVLAGVFFPMAFFGGSTGVIYRQFSITIATSMLLSVVVAIIFTPALCATLLKPHHGEGRGFARWFNRNFERMNRGYVRGARGIVNRPLRFMLVYLLVIGAMGVTFLRLPSSFLPDEDQGVMFIQVTASPGATAEHTERALTEVQNYLQNDEASLVDGAFTVAGFSLSGRGQNAGMAFVRLRDWGQRRGAQDHVQALAGRIMGHFSTYQDATIFAFAPPAILELGNAAGFDFILLAAPGAGHEALMQARNQVLGTAAQNPSLAAVRPNGQSDEPQYRLNIDWSHARALGISVSDVTDTIAAAWGQTYVNDFIDGGRIKRVYVQGDARSRMDPSDLTRWFVRNSQGDMIPLSAFASGAWSYGSPKLERYNGRSSIEILGQGAAGVSSGAAMALMEQIASSLPEGYSFAWTGLSYEEKLSGSQAPLLYAISLLVVFLCLAALYESWPIPVAVMLVVPLGIFGAVLATWGRGLSNDIYFQVGLLTTIGLSAKNAILIVEFAKENFDKGMSLLEAAMHAAEQRLRPILMTSLAFTLGTTPLVIASGAGSGSQNAIGTAVVGGTIAATILAIFFVPLFFVLVLKLFRVKPLHAKEETSPPATLPHPAPGE
ncbi:efflux RND transporter permease subunit [Pseudoroseomonas cervicalis]|uniref:efflux RND transporter permease subunit n=1 Tax=Teichococcus cervicalis TaxID=204525 RepID=UPI002783207D|nr:efflux RND transporter permease subunit [Pseudoroseomonas cervicalis]MDQ1080622.1 multidrug efflux pump [Pseudoroseomonas cervicalis]